jgi:hypothetical protein
VSGTVIETYRQVNLIPGDTNFVTNRINGISGLVWVTVAPGSPPPGFTAGSETLPTWLPASDWGSIAAPNDFTSQMQQDTDLDKVAVFNLMVIPGVTNNFVLSTALAFCERKRAFFVMDPPLTASSDGTDPKFPTAIQDAAQTLPSSANAALYFPYLKSPNPLTGQSTNPITGQPFEIPPAATVAGTFATTDLSRGVWKAPAGFQATTKNTSGVVSRGRMTDQRQGVLNPLGINCLRDFPNIGTAVFGARTTVTQTQEQWRYVPVHGAVSRTDILRQSGLGRVRAERAAAVVGDYDDPQLIHARVVPAGGVPGQYSQSGVQRAVQQPDDNSDGYRSGHRQHRRWLRSAETRRVRNHNDCADGRAGPNRLGRCPQPANWRYSDGNLPGQYAAV